MNPGFRSQVIPEYRLLTDDQIQTLHRAALEVLETIGVRVLNDEGVELLHRNGCTVAEGQTVRFPNWLVEECLRSAPSRIDIYDRNGREAMRLEGRNIHYGMGTDLIHTVDLATGEMRPSVLQDVANAARVADWCPNIDFVASFALPHDVPTNSMYVECARSMLANTTKPLFVTAAGVEDLACIIEMAEVTVGGPDRLRTKPYVIHYSEPTPPLLHSFGAVRKLFLCADKGVPITYVTGAILGASAPVTLAGGIVQAAAEALSGIVLHQLRRKGAPIVSGWSAVPMDMRTSAFCYGAPEYRLTNSAYADLFHYYGIPMWGTVGTDSHVFDQQASMEHMSTTLFAALDGANLVHDVGYLGQGLIGNPAMLVMCDEIIAYVKRVLQGFQMDREAMAIDLMRSVGPGGTYISEDHTLANYKKELWQPRWLNRQDIDTWTQRGSPTYGELTTRKAREVLETHKPEPLAANVAARIDEIARRAESSLAGVHFIA